MTSKHFTPTDEQKKVIDHVGSAFITACPGAGKTRVMVERARQLVNRRPTGRGISFLSFTNAAVSELEGRLRRENILGSPAFPHFVGTFDAFLWQFLIAPFGIDGCAVKPRLIPDKDDWTIQPFPSARSLPLGCFDRATGQAIQDRVQRHGFRGAIAAYETAARNARAQFLSRGELDFVDARLIALARLRDPQCGSVLAAALAARFAEIIVDEAQDCNPIDLEIVGWFRGAGIPVKVICDPNQAIYGFRGGVAQELGEFAEAFDSSQRLTMRGNFRSSSNITKGITAFRAPSMQTVIDEALGGFRDEPAAVHILSYSGQGVPPTVGAKFQELVQAIGPNAEECPVVSATRRTSANALGHPKDSGVRDLSYRLAVAVSDFHHSFEIGGRQEALVAIHQIMLELGGQMSGKTYAQYIAEANLRPDAWRPRAIALAQALRFSSGRYPSAEAWHDEARRLLEPLLPTDGPSINQRLRRNNGLDKALSAKPTIGHPARTIHSVKGQEFPAVCVVMSPATAKSIIDFLSGNNGGDNEEARKIYVGASRAQRFLAIALPRKQAPRLKALMQKMGGSVEFSEI